MRFNLVFFLLGIVSRHSPAVVTSGAFDHAVLAEEICTLDSAFFIGGFEDQTIAEIQHEDASFLATERPRQPLRATDSRVA